MIGADLIRCVIAATSPGAIRETRDAVFQRPEFRDTSSRDNWLLRTLREFFQWLGTLHEASPVLFAILVTVCIVLLVMLVVHIVRQVARAFAIVRKAAPDEAERARRRILSETCHEEAMRFAAEQEFTEAIRHLFLALVYRFDERGRVSLHKAYTNREYLDLLDDRTPARDAMRTMVDLLDIHWYGQSRCDAEQYRACLRDYERLVAIT
jgi:hypothetical protein